MTTETVVREETASGDLAAMMAAIGRRAREAASALALAPAEARTQALRRAAAAVRARGNEILAANADDLAAARQSRIGGALLDRLALDPKRLDTVAQGLEDIAALPDPVGRTLAEWTRPNGLRISRVSVPLGVIGIIYESRPNVTADAGGLAVKSGNAAILRGGSESFRSSRALVSALRDGLRAAGLPEDAIQLVPTRDRAAVGPDADDERRHRRHRAARRRLADRAGNAREPDPGHRASRRAVPHLHPCRGRPEKGARPSHSTPRCAVSRSAARPRRCWSIARSPPRCCRQSSPICAKPAARYAATRRCGRSTPPPRRPATTIGAPNISTRSSRCGWWTARRRRSRISSATARTIPTRS